LPLSTQSATQSIMLSIGTRGLPNSRCDSVVSSSQAVGASLPLNSGRRPKRLPNASASQRMLVCDGPVMLIGVVGDVQCASRRRLWSLASPCQMTSA
jgi:hypothetical protein